jgi:ribosomal protein S18 acetylase RimI-like enzyme
MVNDNRDNDGIMNSRPTQACFGGEHRMFHFRDVTHEDFKIIAAFPQNREEWFYMFPKGVYPISPEQLEEAALHRFSPTVITCSGDLAGYCNFYDVHAGQDCWLGNVIVNPKYRRAGAGAFMLETMKRKALEEYKARELKLVCHNTNTKALLFYYKHGFRPFDMKVMEDYKQDRIAGIMMRIELAVSP